MSKSNICSLSRLNLTYISQTCAAAGAGLEKSVGLQAARSAVSFASWWTGFYCKAADWFRRSTGTLGCFEKPLDCAGKWTSSPRLKSSIDDARELKYVIFRTWVTCRVPCNSWWCLWTGRITGQQSQTEVAPRILIPASRANEDIPSCFPYKILPSPDANWYTQHTFTRLFRCLRHRIIVNLQSTSHATARLSGNSTVADRREVETNGHQSEV